MGIHTQVRKFTFSMADAHREAYATLEAQAPLIHAFNDAWYRADHTWSSTNVCGVPTMKAPTDLWMYHELMWRHRPRTVLETGTACGGSALWFALLMDMLGIDGQVITVDIAPDLHDVAKHPRVVSVTGDSSNPVVARAVLDRVTHPLLVSLDAEHSEEHVAAELALYAPEVRVGEYLVVEDTNISWPEDAGAFGAVQAYLQAHPTEWYRNIWCERYWLTMHPHGWLQRVQECAHAGRESDS